MVVYFHCTQEDLENGETVAECPSCSLIVKVIYDPVSSLLTETIAYVTHSHMLGYGGKYAGNITGSLHPILQEDFLPQVATTKSTTVHLQLAT